MTTTLSIEDRLAQSPVYQSFTRHRFFGQVDSLELTKEQAAVLIEQWWHPLHYFPTFLARCVAVLPDIAAKSAITRILSEEAGGGNAARAHEVIYLDSMQKSGFDRRRISTGAPFAETAALVDGYRNATDTRESALGFVFATETTDLLMVSSIGTAIERTTGVRDNKWVRIHVAQEPGHVENATQALMSGSTAEQERAVLDAADTMWQLWTAFFDRLALEVDVGAGTPSR